MEKETCPRCDKKVKHLKAHITNMHQGEDILKAFKELQAEVAALKKPVPPSYAAVAALPPPPPPAPQPPTPYITGPKRLFPSERTFGEPKELREVLDILMKKTTDNDAFLPLRLAYMAHPEDFTIIGDRHTDAYGNNLHISIEWRIQDQYRTIHIYGKDEFGKFSGTHATLKTRKDKIVQLGKFLYRYKNEFKIQDNVSTGSD